MVAKFAIDEGLLDETRRLAPAGDLFVFGYGSLMWRPGFRYVSAGPARVYGFSRRCAVYSTHYRGTVAAPGLVLGLDVGGSCCGMLYRVAAADKARVMRYLFRREMFAKVYHPRYVCAFADGARHLALTFVVRRDGSQYAAPMPDADAARIISAAAGAGGTNRAYFLQTQQQMRRIGAESPLLNRLCRLLSD